jgi:hypothetical protein
VQAAQFASICSGSSGGSGVIAVLVERRGPRAKNDRRIILNPFSRRPILVILSIVGFEMRL